jgi:hypothetical protein
MSTVDITHVMSTAKAATPASRPASRLRVTLMDEGTVAEMFIEDLL